MRTLFFLALTLVPVLALRRRVKVDEQKAPKVKACQVPQSFVRKVNPNAHRMPTAEEISQPGFDKEPHIEKVYYINLDKAVKRRESIERDLANTFPGVKTERWPATAKNKQSLGVIKSNMSSFSRIGYGAQSGAGTQATYLSHYFLMKNISMEKDPNAVFIIVEDDIKLGGAALMENVQCQLKMLPPEWDMFKFGYWGYKMQVDPVMERQKWKYKYPSCAGEALNNHTCHQEHFNFNYMGNQAYAVRPKGAAILLEHLQKVPIMDIDGAMMPGITWNKKLGEPTWPNTYVSKYNLVGHGAFASDRAFKEKRTEESLEAVDEKTNELLMQETKDLANDEDGRETSFEEFERVQRGETDLSNLQEDQFQ